MWGRENVMLSMTNDTHRDTGGTENCIEHFFPLLIISDIIICLLQITFIFDNLNIIINKIFVSVEGVQCYGNKYANLISVMCVCCIE